MLLFLFIFFSIHFLIVVLPGRRNGKEDENKNTEEKKRGEVPSTIPPGSGGHSMSEHLIKKCKNIIFTYGIK